MQCVLVFFQSGNSQAVQIPKELQFERLDVEYEIEREGDLILIHSIEAPLAILSTNVMELFAAFSDDFMTGGIPEQGSQERELW